LVEFINSNGAREAEYIEIKNILLLAEKTINDSEVTFKTMSYISVEDENDQPIDLFRNNDIDSKALENFTRHLNAIQDRRFKDLRGYGLKQSFTFIPKQLSKKVVRHTLKGFRDQTGKPFMMLTTYHGIFTLRGEPEDLQFTYQVGLGLRTGQGFGMLEVT
ncbi:CRISPR-associated endoribonuclease Cas6, partial [Pseudothermotoga sp.]|uniref:CRISPR-associated endoribonuclease Cas6 n=1 Tax=Pseudothermotoga sp. TaxID=2033661 RepID=UPI0031F627FB